MASMRASLFAAMFFTAPKAVLACPVCFGENDSPLALGMNQGILMMLILVGAVLAAFATFFIHLVRRANMADTDGARLADRPASGHPMSGVQGGTV
jgi:hypothetical protein